jgi:isopenicillin-N epimerase
MLARRRQPGVSMNTAIPALGAAIRHEWALDPDFLTVNHGSYGATPKSVLAAQDDWRRRMEAQPTRFMARVLPGALRQAAAELAVFIGATGDDVVFVENATAGCNAVLRSLAFSPGDEILCLSHVYNAVRNTVRHVAARTGAVVVTSEIPFPRPDSDAVIENLTRAFSPRTRVAVLDHITSGSGLVLPLARMIAACHAAGIPVVVDGAHGPGQVTLDVSALGADWYVGNCHKWLMAPKGAAFLYARADRQQDLHPGTISHGYGAGFRAEFDWAGTFDPSAYLAVPAAILFHAGLGGAHLQARNAALAAAGATLLAGRLGTEVGAAPDMAGAMGLVRLPLRGPVDAARALAFRQCLLDAGTDAPVSALGGAAWLRLSAQAYNEFSDYEKLSAIVIDAIADDSSAPRP